MTIACSSAATSPQCAPSYSTRCRSMVVIGAVSVAVHAALFAIPWHRDAPNSHSAEEQAMVTYTLQSAGAPAMARSQKPAEPTPALQRTAAQRTINPRPTRASTLAPIAAATLAATTEHLSTVPATQNSAAETTNVTNPSSAPSLITLPAAHVGPNKSATTKRDEQLVAIHPTLILDAVRREFNRTKHYPVVAQRRGWQGDVILGFRVERNGHIDDVRVRSGSGHALLDDAATETLRRISLRDETQSLGLDADVELELPVAYRLVEPG